MSEIRYYHTCDCGMGDHELDSCHLCGKLEDPNWVIEPPGPYENLIVCKKCKDRLDRSFSMREVDLNDL